MPGNPKRVDPGFVRSRVKASATALALLAHSNYEGITTMEDTRCCGTGTCIINAEGYCWCGQRWDGTRMCFPQDANSHPSNDKDQAATGAAGAGLDSDQ